MRALLDEAERELAAAGVETPRLDAELLLAFVLGARRSEVVAGLAPPPGEDARERFTRLVARRAAREPLAYIVGEQGFRRIVLRVRPGVLIPRPETETLIEAVEAAAPRRVLDVGAGSGAVALALADELPEASVTAVDVSPDALALARENAVRLGFAERVAFIESDLLAALAADAEFDAIAANLPYVRSAELAGLQPEIARHEPQLALDGGPDGLDAIRRLVAQAPSRLAPGGLLALEIGDDQGAAVSETLSAAGFSCVVTRRDLAGRDRVVSGILRGRR